MQPRFLLLISTIFFSLSIYAQTGVISGKITDASSNQALVGATVILKNSKIKVLSDIDGAYRIGKLAAGHYAVEVTYIGYSPKEINDIDVANNGAVSLNITLELQTKTTIQAVVVTTTSARRENINTILNTRRNAAVVSDAISADIIRKSPDKNISDVLKRVSGVTVQDNKFVVIRGMSDRYNEAMLNGALLPSTEPDRKTFAFDIFPSDIVDNITIIKSALPEYPATFAGGLTQVNLKDVPDKAFFSFKIGSGFNSITVGNVFYHDQKGNSDWIGIDNGKRDLSFRFPNVQRYKFMPLNKQLNYASLFPNDWSIEKYNSAPLNTSLQLSGGFNAIGKNGYPKFGGIFGVSYASSYKFSKGTIIDYGAVKPVPPDSISGIGSDNIYYNFRDSNYVHTVLASALANFALKIDPNNKLFFNNLFAVNSTNQTGIRNGSAQQIIGGTFDSAYFAYSHYFQSNIIYNTQLGGEHYLSKAKLRIKWLGYYTNFYRDEPDYRQMVYYRYSPDDPYLAFIASPTLSTPGTGGVRFYFKTKDESEGANIDMNKSFQLFKQNQAFKFGVAYYHDTRDRSGRFLRNDQASFNYDLLLLPPDKIFAIKNFDVKKGFVLTDVGLPLWTDYNGSNKNVSAYAMFDNKFTEKLRLAWGLRYEHYNNRVTSYPSINPAEVKVLDTSFKDLLPSANFIYSVLPKANIRLSYSRTVARPLYRELAATQFYDFFQQTTYTGANLVETHIDNYEIRWEQYFPNAQYYSVSGYYKKFKNPIEQKVVVDAAESRTITWQNAPSAELWGIEGELRKDFDFIAPALKDLFFYVNASYIHSIAFVAGNGSDTANRPLQGQSPYVINTSLQYSSEKSGLNISLLYNEIGSRIFAVSGPNNSYALWEKVHPQLDFKISKNLFKDKGVIEFSLADILHKNDIFYWNFDGNKKYNAGYPDVVIQSKTFGTTATLSFGYRF